VNERGLVEVPENAIRDEPVAFGLTPIQLGICALAVIVGAILNLLPVWEPIRILLVLVGAAPIGLAATLPVRGEPAYRWLVRAVRHLRGRRTWEAVLEARDKAQISGLDETATIGAPELAPEAMPEPSLSLAAQQREAPADRPAAPPVPHLRVVRPAHEGVDETSTADPVPHVVGGLQIACLLSFAGGVGKTTLAVEMGSLVGSRARYRTLEGEERSVRVLVVDAARSTPACHLRLGVDASTVSRLLTRYDWPDAVTFDGRVVDTPFGVSLLPLPQLPLQGLGPELPFGPIEADAILEAAERAGFQVVVVDLGSQIEDGHRHLMAQATAVLGVVTPRIEALSDVLRITSYVRAVGAGRKLGLVANFASDVGQLPILADEEQVPIVATVPRGDAFMIAGDRGIPAWRDSRDVEAAILRLAAAVWPLIAHVPRSSERPVRSALTHALRRLLRAGGRSA
jgi:MinD-like ATPase involved in chromosome partitioning or flagellar assembly